MSKLLSFLNRNNTDDNTDAIRRTATATMAHLLERNRKFELFLVEKLAELEKRTGPGRLLLERLPAPEDDDFLAETARHSGGYTTPSPEPGTPAQWDAGIEDEPLLSARSFVAGPSPQPARPVSAQPPQPVKSVPIIDAPSDWGAFFGLNDGPEADEPAGQAGANSLPDDDGAKGEFD